MAGRTHLMVAPASGATGEMACGLRLAWQLHAAGDRVLFLAPGVHSKLLAGTPFPHGKIDGLADEIPRILPVLVAEKRADDVILVDLASMLMSCVMRGHDVGFLGRQKVPVVGLDLWSLGETSMVVDTGTGDLRLPRAALDLVPERLVIVPFARPTAPGACGLWLEGAAVDRAAARARWAEGAERLIVMPTALWQTQAAVGRPALARVPERLVATLARLPAGVRMVHVGPHPLPGHELLGDRYRHLAPLPAAEFRDLVAAADVFLTLNRVSTSAAVAFELDVPVVSLYGRDPAFLAWPGGFDRFFGEALADNPWAVLQHPVALEDTEELLDALLRPPRDPAAAAAYRAQVAALPTAGARLHSILGVRP